MKIEFDFDCRDKGTLTIDRVVMTIDIKPGETKLNGVTQTEMENTLGGIVAKSLFSQLANIMQAWAIVDEEYNIADTWCALPDEVACDVADKLYSIHNKTIKETKMKIEKEIFDKLIAMGWTPPPGKLKRYRLKVHDYEITQQGQVINCTDSVPASWTRNSTTSCNIAADRMRKTMLLSALAAELGGERRFVNGEYNWYIMQDADIGMMFPKTIKSHYEPEKVYMTEECAEEICRMLNEGEFKL